MQSLQLETSQGPDCHLNEKRSRVNERSGGTKNSETHLGYSNQLFESRELDAESQKRYEDEFMRVNSHFLTVCRWKVAIYTLEQR